MNNLHSVTDMISTEFISTPIQASIAALVFIFTIFNYLRKKINKIKKYKKGHNRILKNAKVPPIVLNLFMVSIPLKQVPKILKADIAIPFIFWALFIGSVIAIFPSLFYVVKAPADSAALIWSHTGERFYISNTTAEESTLFSHPRWVISISDCNTENKKTFPNKSRPSPDLADGICELLTTEDGQQYLTNSIKKAKKEKIPLFIFSLFTEVVLLWLTLSLSFNTYYTIKVRKYILAEQEKAKSYVM